MEQQKQLRKAKRLKIAIIILAVLLLLSAGGLTARYFYLHFVTPAQATIEVPDNLIGDETSSNVSDMSEENTPPIAGEPDTGETNAEQSDTTESGGTSSVQSAQPDKPSSPVLELYTGRPGVNQRFEVGNMLPGDSETKYFCVKAYHDADISLFFRADVTEQTKGLGDVLQIKVTHLDTGKVLCDAPFSKIDGQEFSGLLKSNTQKETTAFYKIDVSLDPSVGNEYQAASLLADFEWYVKDTGGLTPPPQTGGTTNLVLWVILAASSLLLVLLLLIRRRKGDEQHG